MNYKDAYDLIKDYWDQKKYWKIVETIIDEILSAIGLILILGRLVGLFSITWAY